MDEFYFEKKIYYHDTDCGGVVYYANYLKHLEEARTEYFLSRGADLKGLAEQGIFFVVARVEIDYKSPAFYQDRLTIVTKIDVMKAVSMQFFQRVLKGELAVAEARTRLVCVKEGLKPIPIPEAIKSSLSRDQEA